MENSCLNSTDKIMDIPSRLPADVRAYLDRIGFTGPIDRSAHTLAGLQAAHLMAVPYENLDILGKVPLSLEIPDLYDKLVRRRRGGYCFELNGLFAWLLEQLGFPVTQFMARFLRDETGIPMRRHRVLRVEAEGQPWLCDVGVGGACPLLPLLLEEGVSQPQGEGDAEVYRLVREPFLGWIVEEWRKGAWSRYYSFTEEPQLPLDYVMPSFWCEHAPESFFTQTALVSRRTPEGRVTVSGEEFRIFDRAGVQAFTPASPAERNEALRRHFGICLEASHGFAGAVCMER